LKVLIKIVGLITFVSGEWSGKDGSGKGPKINDIFRTHSNKSQINNSTIKFKKIYKFHPVPLTHLKFQFVPKIVAKNNEIFSDKLIFN
jgi:hypothetical protein